MAKIVIDNPKASEGAISIADLAQYTIVRNNKRLCDVKSSSLNIYEVEDCISKEWKFELERFEYEYATGYSGYFKDGSSIHISATAEEHNPEKYGYR